MTSKEDKKDPEITEFGPLIMTTDGSLTVRHLEHGQEFHSNDGAKFEAWNLYVTTSGFLKAIELDSRDPIRILDVGMGLGYNAAASIAAWLGSSGVCDVEMISLENNQRLIEVVAGAAAPWQKGWSDDWMAGPRSLNKTTVGYQAYLNHPRTKKNLRWTIIAGDAAAFRLNDGHPGFDFIWQDPFTPELNPSMWSTGWFQKLLKISHSECVLVTYSVARIVKNALDEAGWLYERVQTPGRKRHWLKARPK